MAEVKISSFINELIIKGDRHPLYQETFDAYLVQGCHTIRDAPKAVEAKKFFSSSYKNLLGHFKNHFILSETNFIPEELEFLISNLKPDVLGKQSQLQILQAFLNYAKKQFGFDSPNIPVIVTLKRDKPILSPVELIKLPIVEQLNAIIDSDLNVPNRMLPVDAKLGRTALLLYWTVGVSKSEELISILESPQNIFYVGGVCYWQPDKRDKCSNRFILSDVAVVALQQWNVLNVNKPFKIMDLLVKYLNSVSDLDWSALSILKLRTLRKIDNVLRYGPVQYQMYILPRVCQALPEHAFYRLLTDKACRNFEPRILEPSSDNLILSKPWKMINAGDTPFVDIKITLKNFDKLFERLLKFRLENNVREKCINFMKNIIKKPEIAAVPYFWLLCSWLYSLLKHGGTSKSRLKLSTIIDYVKSLSKPFLTVFSTCNIGLLSGEDWASKLNDSAELFSSAQRKKYVYYFAHFLIDNGLVRDLCLSDIDIIGSSSQVDANMISPTHIDEILNYLTQHFNDGLVYHYAYFLLCFCFFSGLRRNEAAKLTWSDFSFSILVPSKHEFDYVKLSVRPNQHRTLKTSSARREIPLDAFWPKIAIEKLRTKYQIYHKMKQSKNALLFDNQKVANQAYDLITDLMRHYTHDYTLRIHHLRHSFANWSWCRLNPHIIEIGKIQLKLFNHEIFSAEYLSRLQNRLCYSNNTRKKMFILSHLLGHKDVYSTLNSYLHLKDVLHYLELQPRFTLTKYFCSECVGRSTLMEQEQGLSLAERIQYYTKDTETKLDIKPASIISSLKLPTLANFVKEIHPTIKVSSLTWAKALAALKFCSIVDSSYNFNVPTEQLQQLFTNAEQVHKNYPRTGKPLPLIPNFPRLTNVSNSTNTNGDLAKSGKVFTYLCNKFDKSIEAESLTLTNVRFSMNILNYAVPGKDYALRCPDSKVSRMFIRFCQLLGLKDRHLRFKYHRADLPLEVSNRIQRLWMKTIVDYGFSEKNFLVGSESEGRFLGKHDGNGFLEILLVNNAYKRVQRHQSLFSFLHLILILSYNEKNDIFYMSLIN